MSKMVHDFDFSRAEAIAGTKVLNVAQLDLLAAIKFNIPVMLWGSPGIGKSATVAQVAQWLSWTLIDIRLSMREAVDLRGLPAISRESQTTRWLAPDELPNAERDGEFGILLLDELNACPLSVQVAAYQLILDRKLGDYHLPPGWRVVAAGNKLTDRAAATRISTALANRMQHIDMEPDLDSFCQWGIENGIHSDLIGFLRYRPHLLFKMPDGAREFPSPRSWSFASKYMNETDVSTRMRRIGQIVGSGPAGELEEYLTIAGELEPLAYILANPDKARIPDATKIAALYAVTTGIAYVADKSTIRNGAKYIARLADATSAEFKALFAKLVLMRDKSLAAYGFAPIVTGKGSSL